MPTQSYKRQPQHVLLSIALFVVWLAGSILILGFSAELATSTSLPSRHDSILIMGFGLTAILTIIWMDRLKRWGFRGTERVTRMLFVLYLLFVVVRAVTALLF
jgi:predicted MFS family arabinose efflux permease